MPKYFKIVLFNFSVTETSIGDNGTTFELNKRGTAFEVSSISAVRKNGGKNFEPANQAITIVTQRGLTQEAARPPKKCFTTVIEQKTTTKTKKIGYVDGKNIPTIMPSKTEVALNRRLFKKELQINSDKTQAITLERIIKSEL